MTKKESFVHRKKKPFLGMDIERWLWTLGVLLDFLKLSII